MARPGIRTSSGGRRARRKRETAAAARFRPARTASVLCALGTLVLIPLAAAAQSAPWWNKGWPYRVPVTVTDVRRGPAAVVTVPTAARGRPDGGDVRVVWPDGKLVPHRVLDAGRDDAVTLVFPVPWRTAPRGARPRYWIYFGNKSAKVPREPYDGAHGPVLEVRRWGQGGSIRSWAGMQRLIEGSPEVLGRMPVPRVFMGLNPFGPERACVALIRGWLNCRKPGLYTFAVNAVDAAFFLVDGRMVARWPGRHNPWWGSSGRHAGRVKLDRGWHSFLYAHATPRRGVCCSLGVKAPGWRRLALAPYVAFLRWAPAVVGRLETRSHRPAGFFTWRRDHDLGLSWRNVVALRFEERFAVNPDRVRSWAWDFGDGVTSRQRDPVHVFLERGRFTVRLTARLRGGQKVTAAHAIAVNPIGTVGRQIYDHLRRDARLLATYPPGRLTPQANLNAVFVFRALRQYEKAAPFLEAAFRDRPPLATQAMVEEAFFLAETLRDAGSSPARTLAMFRYIAEKAPREADRRLAEAWAGAIELDALHAVRRARATLAALLRRDPRARDDALRLALIKMADVHLEEGQRELAARKLARAQNMKPQRTFRGDFEVAHGQHLVAYEEAMAHQDWAAALRTLDDWEWTSPIDKLAGTIQFLRADLAAARGQPRRALTEIRRLEAANPRSGDLPSALILAAACHEKLGEGDRARACYRRLVEEFPTTGAAREAKKRLAKAAAAGGGSR